MVWTNGNIFFRKIVGKHWTKKNGNSAIEDMPEKTKTPFTMKRISFWSFSIVAMQYTMEWIEKEIIEAGMSLEIEIHVTYMFAVKHQENWIRLSLFIVFFFFILPLLFISELRYTLCVNTINGWSVGNADNKVSSSEKKKNDSRCYRSNGRTTLLRDNYVIIRKMLNFHLQ